MTARQMKAQPLGNRWETPVKEQFADSRTQVNHVRQDRANERQGEEQPKSPLDEQTPKRNESNSQRRIDHEWNGILMEQPIQHSVGQHAQQKR